MIHETLVKTLIVKKVGKKDKACIVSTCASAFMGTNHST